MGLVGLMYLQVVGIVSDTASNMRKMMDYLPELSWAGCVNHIIQLVINVGYLPL